MSQDLKAEARTRRKKAITAREGSDVNLGSGANSNSNDGGTKESNQLPKGWKWVTLGEVAESMKNGIYKPASSYAEDGLACLRMYNIDNGKVVWRDVKRMHLSEEEILQYELLPGDLLVNRVNSRELVGKSAAIPSGLERCVFESKNIRVRVRRSLVSPQFINYRLLSEGSRYFTQNAQQVVGMASISQPQVARFPLPLPSLPEQQRIVAEIEKQFTRLDAGVAALRRVQANLKRYRAAVLKAACEGKLVENEVQLAKAEGRRAETGEQLLQRILAERRKNWTGRGKYKEPTSPDTPSLPRLPAGWTWVTWEMTLANEEGAFKRGPFGSALKKSIFVEKGFKVYEQYCPINDDCSFARYYITPEKFEELRAFEVKAGDYLISCSGVTLGRITRVPSEFERGIINQALLRVRMNDQCIDHRYFLHLFRSALFQKSIFDNSTGSAIPNVKGVKELKAMVIPLPPLAEQTRIVAEVERRLSVVEELEAAVTANLQRATRLRQSVLTSAFAGEI